MSPHGQRADGGNAHVASRIPVSAHRHAHAADLTHRLLSQPVADGRSPGRTLMKEADMERLLKLVLPMALIAMLIAAIVLPWSGM